MTEQTQNPIADGPSFSHRINQNFYESMLATLQRAVGIADLMEVAGNVDCGYALDNDSIRAGAQAIRLELEDAKAMLEARRHGWS